MSGFDQPFPISRPGNSWIGCDEYKMADLGRAMTHDCALFRLGLYRAGLILASSIALLSGPATATEQVNWVHTSRDAKLGIDYFVGQNTVFRMGGGVLYFQDLSANDRVQDGVKAYRSLVEVLLSNPRQFRIATIERLDINHRTIGNGSDNHFNPVPPGSFLEDEINYALRQKARSDQTNWTRVGVYQDEKMGFYEYFLDTSSIASSDYSISFRYARLFDRETDAQKPFYGSPVKEAVYKAQVTLQPGRQHRVLERSTFNFDGELLSQTTTPTQFGLVRRGTAFDQLIDLALQSARSE